MCDVLSDIDTHLNPSEESDCNDPSAANLILASLQSLGNAAPCTDCSKHGRMAEFTGITLHLNRNNIIPRVVAMLDTQIIQIG